MLEYSFDDVVQVFDDAKNINAALKKFLKAEVASDPKSARFIKDLRTACSAKDPQRKNEYLKNKSEGYEPLLFGVARYAYAEEVTSIANDITEKYADKFNATYTQSDDGVEVKDTKGFDGIVKEVMTLVDKGLKEKGVPSSPFMKNVLLFYIFDAEVLKHVMPIAEEV